MFKYAPLILAVAGIVSATALVKRQKAFEPPPVQVQQPPSAPYPEAIGARGLVEGINENIRIAPAVAGLVMKVPVKVGDEVKVGEVLFEQDVRDADALIDVQDANVIAIQASLKESEVALADREDQWHRIERLGANRVVSEDEKQRTLFALRAAQTRVEARKADLEAAKAQAKKARVQRELLVVRAPQDGTILQVNVRAGEFSSPSVGERPMLIGQTKELQLRADVDEDNAARVTKGCEAVAFVKGRRDKAIPLKFVRVEPYIVPKRSLSGESTERVDTRVLQVIFQFERPEVPVYVGQQLDVFLKG